MKTLKLTIGKFLAALCIFQFCTGGVQAQTKKGVDRPKLVVGIVVDQMRWDYLYKFSDRYTDNGFKRLVGEGFSFENCMIDYLPSFTAIGHSTVYTGSVPSIHGIAGNTFIDQRTGLMRYCSEDPNVKSVGSNSPEDKAGKMSPFNLKATTVTDELKLATNFQSKVVGVAMKDRGSILPAGHVADAAYWFDGKSGNWITSTWYTKDLPQWVKDYNAKKMPDKYLKQDWNTLFPIDTYTLSVNDNNNYEAGFKGLDKPLFPIKTSELIEKNGYELIGATPYGNTISLEMAKLAIENEKMGQGQFTDFLALSLSSPDKIGHNFSINSIKVEDCYLRLDREIADFLSYLDKTVGKGEYLVFLTADHGGGHNGKFLQDHGLPGGFFIFWEEDKKMNAHLQTIFGYNDLILGLGNYQVNFNYKRIKETGVDMEKLKTESIKYLNGIEGMNYVVDMNKISEATIPARIKEMIVKGYNRNLSGEIQFILNPGIYDFDYPDPRLGGTHGTWSPFDTHIPFVLMGWGIQHGSSNKEVYMTDIAPTVAALLHIQMPSGCIGKPALNTK